MLHSIKKVYNSVIILIYFSLLLQIGCLLAICITFSLLLSPTTVFAAERDIGGMLVNSAPSPVNPGNPISPWITTLFPIKPLVKPHINPLIEGMLFNLKFKSLVVNKAFGGVIPNVTGCPNLTFFPFWYYPAHVLVFNSVNLEHVKEMLASIPSIPDPSYAIPQLNSKTLFISKFTNYHEVVALFGDPFITKLLTYMHSKPKLISSAYAASYELDFNPFMTKIAKEVSSLLPGKSTLFFSDIDGPIRLTNKCASLWEQTHNPVFLHAMTHLSTEMAMRTIRLSNPELSIMELMDEHQRIYNELFQSIINQI